MPKIIYAVKGAEVISRRFSIPFADLVDVFAEIPSAEQNRPKGKWVYDKPYTKCSVCGETPYDDCCEYRSPYCPFCGAEMGEEK